MRKNKNRRSGISFATALLIFATLLFAVLSTTRLMELHEQKIRLEAEARELEFQKEMLKEELAQIRKEANTTNSKAYVESTARTHLDMVYPGEIIFHVTGE